MDTEQYLPEPVGYRMIVRPHKIQAKSTGGIILVEESKVYADLATFVGTVVKMGPDCYEAEKFSTKWCQVGDVVVFARNVGQKIDIKADNGEVENYLMINDSDVRGIVLGDPSRIRMYL